MTIIEPEVIDKLITDIVSGVVATSGDVLVGDWLEDLYLLGRIASGEEL
jgi:hypothetical protein